MFVLAAHSGIRVNENGSRVGHRVYGLHATTRKRPLPRPLPGTGRGADVLPVWSGPVTDAQSSFDAAGDASSVWRLPQHDTLGEYM